MLIQGLHLGVLHRLKAQLHQCDAADQSGSAKAGSSLTWCHWFDFTVSHFQSFDWLSSFSIHHPLYRLVRLGKCFKNLPLSLKLKSLTDLGWFVAKDVFELFFFLTTYSGVKCRPSLWWRAYFAIQLVLPVSSLWGLTGRMKLRKITK